MHRARVLILAVLLGFALPTLVSVGSASAKPIERGEVHDTIAEHFDDFCDVPGFSVDSVLVFDLSYAIKSRGRDGLPFYAEHASSSQTFTNPENGLSAVDRTHVVDKDLHVTDNGDGTFTIVALVTGPSSLYGPNGKAIARNPGQVRFELLLDNGGTPTDPSDDFELDRTLIKGSTGRSDDYCEAIFNAIG